MTSEYTNFYLGILDTLAQYSSSIVCREEKLNSINSKNLARKILGRLENYYDKNFFIFSGKSSRREDKSFIINSIDLIGNIDNSSKIIDRIDLEYPNWDLFYRAEENIGNDLNRKELFYKIVYEKNFSNIKPLIIICQRKNSDYDRLIHYSG